MRLEEEIMTAQRRDCSHENEGETPMIDFARWLAASTSESFPTSHRPFHPGGYIPTLETKLWERWK